MGQLYKVTVRVTEIEAVHFSQRAGTLHNALQNGPALFQQLVPDLRERRLGENT